MSRSAFALILAVGWTVPARAADAPAPIELRIARATGPIVVDGDLSDPAWRDAPPIERWFETNPGDNVEPKVRNVGRLAYDDRYLYAAFEFEDPEPRKIRAPFSDRDNIDGSTDYGGLILDPEHDRKTAILFLANPRGIQYDAINSDVNFSEDSSPDWFWDSAARLTDRGWVLELRIPFSSLRYPSGDPRTWGVMLYRNWPRDRRYQMFSTRIPRDSGCFICNENTLVGLENLPKGGNWVVAPYGTARQESVPRDGLGSSLVHPAPEYDAGVDVKWSPNAVTSLDFTVNPDFSQIESDTAQITANERFALFYPEKRPFFLEGLDLLSTPIQAVYTRTITSPRWGARATGKSGDTSYTALVADDRGGGTVVIPGPDGSEFAPQDFESTVAIGRVRHDIDGSFVSALVTDREVRGSGAYNRVVGPDFQWRASPGDLVAGQLLLSDTRDDTGRTTSRAGEIWYQHNDARFDAFVNYRDYGDGFRADVGFVPQAAFREAFFEGGFTRRPEKGFLSRQRIFLQLDYNEDRDGRLIQRFVSPGTGMDGRANSFFRVWFVDAMTRVVAGADPDGLPVYRLLPQRTLRFQAQASPWSWLTLVSLQGRYGKDIDFAGARSGYGGQITFEATVRPTDHLELVGIADRRWLDIGADGGDGSDARLFTAKVERLKATYTFTARSFLRLIAQRQATSRDPALYPFAVPARSSTVNLSALFAYKLNWQSVLFFGYGDDREYATSTGAMEPASRSFFLKLSYAFQG